jgi:hypothetical protein
MRALLLLLVALAVALGLNASHSIAALGDWISADSWHLGATVLGLLLLLFFLGLYDAERDLAVLEGVTLHSVTVKPEFHRSLTFLPGRNVMENLLYFRVEAEVRNASKRSPVRVEFNPIELITRARWSRQRVTAVRYEREIQSPIGGVGGLSWRPWEEYEIDHKRKIKLDFGVRDGHRYLGQDLVVRITMDVVGQQPVTQEVQVTIPAGN